MALKQLHIGLQEVNVGTEPEICAPEQNNLRRIPFADTCISYRLPTSLQKTFISREDAYGLVKDCRMGKDPVGGTLLHSLIIRSGLDSLAVLMDHLIHLFADDGSLVEGYRVLDKIAKTSAYSSSAIIQILCILGK